MMLEELSRGPFGLRPDATILLIQLGRLGDVVLTTPAIRCLRASFPLTRIELLTRPAFAPVLHGNPDLDAVREIEPGARGVLDWLRFNRRAERRYDIVVDFQSTPHSAILAWMTGAPTRIGFARRNRPGYTHRIEPGGRFRYSAGHKMELLEPLGARAGSLRLDLTLSRFDREFAARLWEQLGWDDGAPVAALSPVSRRGYERWPLDRFATVADELSRRFDGRLIITSGPGERHIARKVAELMSEPAVWDYPETTIRELAAVYERCEMVVGCDNGPKHLACALGVPTLTLFRARLGVAFTNPDTPRQWAVEAPDDGGPRTLDRLQVEPVLEALDRALDELFATTAGPYGAMR